MPTLGRIHALLARGCAQMHVTRRRALLAVVEAALRGGTLSLTSLGRALAGTAYVKHKIKRVDRLLSNRKLAAERDKIYEALTRWLIGSQTQPVIIIDWSDLSADRRWHLLRAAAPMRGRSLTLYEEVHPLCRLANPQVQRRFLLRLRALLPASCTPIIVTDAGFRAPWFRLVQALGWQFVGRVRNRDFVRGAGSPDWMSGKSLYVRAHRRAQALGSFELVRARPLPCALWLLRQPQHHRVHRTRCGALARSAHSLKCAAREREPWLLASSASLSTTPATQIVAWYRMRMQIEESFRDLKSTRYGLGLARSLSRRPERLANLLLIAALALLACWLIGLDTIARTEHHRLQTNSSRHRAVLSVITIGRLVAYLAHHPLLTE
ncbi:MAG TPA: IS4 family transposase [Burkholderiales bacterium]|nr:IS4 family transposase [Burkholderiales bacterium]